MRVRHSCRPNLLMFVVIMVVLIVVAAGAPAHAQSRLSSFGAAPGLPGQSTALLGALSIQTSPQPDGIQLQPGYRHRRIPTVDTTKGVIWKEGGPRIEYEIDLQGLSQSGIYAQTGRGIWKTTVTTANGIPREVVLDEEANSLMVSVANVAKFIATDVKSRRDLAEVLLMVMTYDLRMPR